MSEQDDIRGFLPSASSFAMDWHCPGRQNLLRELREQGGLVELEDPAMIELAARGSRIHQARANGGHTLHLKDEGEVEAYTQSCALEKQIVEDWRAEHGITEIADPIVEERLWLHREDTMQPILSGELDVFYQSGAFGLCCDWKTGNAIYVEPTARNFQLRIYALLAWKEWPQLKRIRVALIMAERFGPKVDVADFTKYDLAHIEHAVRHTLWLSGQPDAELNAGAWCRFCPAAKSGQCPEAVKMASLPAVTSNGDPLALVKAMPVADLAAVFKKKAIVTQVFAAISERLSALSDEELAAIGIERTKGRKNDKIVDTYGAWEYLINKGLPVDGLAATMSFGKESLIALLASTWGISEKEAAQKFDFELDAFIERGRSKPSLEEAKL